MKDADKNLIQVHALDRHFTMRVHEQNELVSSILRERGAYSHRDLLVLQQYLKPGTVFLDIGANIGWYSLVASALVGHQGKVISFEPDPKNAELLSENLQLNQMSNTEVKKMALAADKGSLALIRSENNFGDHYVVENSENPDQVAADALDNVITPGVFEKVALIKMDVQGSEPSVLRGMEGLLQVHRPPLLIEFSPFHLYRAGNSPFEIFAFIEKNDYIPFQVHDTADNGQILTPVGVEELLKLTFQLKTVDHGIDLLLLPNLEKMAKQGVQDLNSRRPQRAEKIFTDLLRHVPDSFDFKLNLALALETQGHWNEATRLLRELINATPEESREQNFAKHKLSWHLMREGNFKQGLEYFRLGRDTHTWGAYGLNFRTPRLTPTDSVEGKTILVAGDGGYGDQIFNVRFCETLKQRGARILYFFMGKSLASVFQRQYLIDASFEHLQDIPAFDYWVACMDLPAALGLENPVTQSSAYLTSDPLYNPKWQEAVAKLSQGKLKVGLRWRGDKQNDFVQNRNIPFEQIQRMVKTVDADYFSFQTMDTEQENETVGTPLGSKLTSWEDTLAALNQMDLVITSCTSIAHASAALGKPTWVLLSHNPYYVWASGETTSPWYPTVRLFRLHNGGWAQVVGEVIEALKKV